jgi:phosphatidylserine decarboxylase
VLFVLFRFYRDPERNCPQDPRLFVSPADGRILYVRRARAGTIPDAIKGRSHIHLDELAGTELEIDDAWIIGIGMTLLDVHVNRAPCSGSVLASVHTEGRFLSLKDPQSLTVNERNTVSIDTPVGAIAVVQIASKQVRRIRSRVRSGDHVVAGQRIGSILFGSQVDLILPTQGTAVCVYEGQQLTAGRSVVAVVT